MLRLVRKRGHRFLALQPAEALLPAAFVQYDHHRLRHDSQIFPDALALQQVLQIVSQFSSNIVEAGVVALIDLRPASNAGSRPLPQRVIGDEMTKPREYAWTLRSRANYIHVALEH